ncbi:MAG: TlpA disulfide reductase family protein [Burkholderiaceae bacterium]
MRLSALHQPFFALLLALLPLLGGATPTPGSVRWTDIQLVDGGVLKASELAGQTVVVEFWASWCPFCARQNPHIEKLHRTQGGKGLVVLTFTLDRTDEAAREYLKKHGYTFAAARSTKEIESWFGGRRALPEVYVVDPSGRIVFREAG